MIICNMSNDGLGQMRGVFPILQARKTNFHHMTIAVIEAARKSMREIGASVLTTEFHLCQQDCLLQHVIPEADLASLADALSKRSLLR
jgi:hypothetical protein